MSRFTYAPPSGGWPQDRSTRPAFTQSSKEQAKAKPQRGQSQSSRSETTSHAPVSAPTLHPRGMSEQSVDRCIHNKREAALVQRAANESLQQKSAKAFSKIQRDTPRQNLQSSRDR